ncbi:MAG: hypothetical protein SFU99_22380 [Saprospiraceae bacterium]|nr:hypothetical protein [Saprospiraceae bacterium]
MPKTINTNKKAKKSVRLWLPWVIILIAFAGLVVFSLLPSKEKPLSGPRFQKEGTLQFIGLSVLKNKLFKQLILKSLIMSLIKHKA